MQKKVWFTQDKEKHYLVPNGHRFMEGEQLITSTDKISKSVDKDSIVEFYVTKQQVHKHLENELDQAIDNTKNAFIELKAFYNILGADDPLRTKSTAHKINQYQQLISQMFGIPSTPPCDITEKNQNATELLNGIEKYITDGQAQESLQEVSGYLKKIASQLDKPENQQKSLDELISIITNELSDDSEKEKREMEARIKKSAQDAISISLDKVGFDVFKGVKSH